MARPVVRRFALVRHQDVSGLSGTGTVVYGTEFADGSAVIAWTSSAPAISVWPGGTRDALMIHGRDGRTVIRWIDPFGREPDD